jgi:hypothetical protein
MLEWIQAGGGARLIVLVHHDDAEREWAYDTKSTRGTPGSTYTLLYAPEKDRLEGNYYQALQGQTYAIGIIRIN